MSSFDELVKIVAQSSRSGIWIESRAKAWYQVYIFKDLRVVFSMHHLIIGRISFFDAHEKLQNSYLHGVNCM